MTRGSTNKTGNVRDLDVAPAPAEVPMTTDGHLTPALQEEISRILVHCALEILGLPADPEGGR